MAAQLARRLFSWSVQFHKFSTWLPKVSWEHWSSMTVIKSLEVKNFTPYPLSVSFSPFFLSPPPPRSLIFRLTFLSSGFRLLRITVGSTSRGCSLKDWFVCGFTTILSWPPGEIICCDYTAWLLLIDFNDESLTPRHSFIISDMRIRHNLQNLGEIFAKNYITFKINRT